MIADAPWWILLLAAIGLLGMVGVVFTMFSAFGDRPKRIFLNRSYAVGNSEFLLSLSGNLNLDVSRGGEARLLNNGAEFLPALEAALEAARRSINFMVYIWEPGAMSDRIFEVLIDRAADGIPVRVMADGLGGLRAPDEDIRRFRNAGGQWCVFQPPRFGKLTRFHKRNHRRAIVIDGCVGFTGGIAVMDRWLGDGGSPEHWRDSMVQVRGTIARNLQSAFCQLWSHVTGEILLGPEFFPDDAQAAAAETQPLSDDGAESTGGSAHVHSGGYSPIREHLSVVSSPSDAAHPLRRLYWTTFSAARERLYIVNPYFVPDEAIASVLKERAAAGVDVRVLVPNEYIDVKLVRWASHSYYDELVSAGVRIFEYQPTMIHHKILVVDGRWSIVGSANMDVRSKELNQENVLGLLDADFGRTLEKTILRDLDQSREILLDEWRRRPLWHRALERFGRLFEEQV